MSFFNKLYEKQKEIIKKVAKKTENVSDEALSIVEKKHKELIEAAKQEIEKKLLEKYNTAVDYVYDKIIQKLYKKSVPYKILAKTLEVIKPKIIDELKQ